jgi:hypothetical protein
MVRLSEQRSTGARRAGIRAITLGAGLALVGAVVGAAPASADTGALTYNCSASILTNQLLTATVHATAPATATVGDTVALSGFSADVTVNSGATGALYWFLGARSVNGTASVQTSVDNAGTSVPQPNAALAIPSAPVPSSGELKIVASGPGPSFVTTTAGTVRFQVGGFTGDLIAVNSTGGTSAAPVNCVLNPGQDPTVASVTVSAPA